MAVFDGKLENLKAAVPASRSADCPEPAVWREIAVALTPSDEALAHLQHASRCDFCGPLLREAVAEMNANITAAEATQIAALESARPEWQQELAARIAGTPAPSPARGWRWWSTVPRLALTGVALAVISAASWLAVRETRPVAPADLLANAYSEQRSFELRIAGASYAPVRVQRGGESSFLSRPEALLKAEARIAAEIGSHPSDPNWLQAKARADLLEGKYDSAIDTLRHALQIAPKTPSLLIDQATAYFQRGQAADRPEDMGAAYEWLSRALAIEPDNPVALFNRAIVAEHQFLFHQAVDDWDHYLRIDSGSEWAAEARQRADAVRAKLKQHDQSHAQPLLTPAQIAAQIGAELHAGSPSAGMMGTPELRAQVDQRVEEYLHESVISWLPLAYPQGKALPDAGATQALFFLAGLTAQQHGDRWLSDLLAGSASPTFPQAIASLAAAVKASDKSDYDTSAKQALTAGTLFHASGNAAGALYSDFEQAFSAQMLRHSESCRDRTAAAQAEAEKYPYWWLQVQLGLEKAFCFGVTGNLGLDEKTTRQAAERAQRAGYGALFLRSLVFVAQDKFDTGDHDAAWKWMVTGLSSYWSRQLPTMRAYNLYGLAAEIAEGAELPNLQLGLWNEALDVIDVDQAVLLRAGAHSEVARAAAAAGHAELAERHYVEADQLYARVPPSDAVRSFRMWTQIEAAQLEAHLRPDDALARLTSIQEQIQHLHENYMVQAFYSALGQAELAQRRYSDAERSLHAGLTLAQQNLSSLHSEEQRVRWSKDAAPIYLGLAQAKLAQQQDLASLEIFESYLGAGRSAADSLRTAPDESSESLPIAPQLPRLSHQTVLAYVLLPGGIGIWNYDDRGVNARWLPRKNQVVLELAARLDDLVSDPNSDPQAFRRDSRMLYELLITPIESRLEPGRTIVIEADGALSRVPFEALLDSNGHYLIERAPVVHSLGMYAEDSLRPDLPISAQSSALIVASTATPPGSGLVPLPEVGSETEAVAARFRAPRILQDRQATLELVASALPAASVFHFAGHALANSQQTGLMLDDRDPQTDQPRLLNADTLRRMRARDLQLAVLSACNTASTAADDSDSFSGITDGLMRAGVPHVVASRWAVDSVQSANFVDDFYRNLLSGSSVSESTRATARKMLANPLTAHPYFWSAFAAYGRP